MGKAKLNRCLFFSVHDIISFTAISNLIFISIWALLYK